MHWIIIVVVAVVVFIVVVVVIVAIRGFMPLEYKELYPMNSVYVEVSHRSQCMIFFSPWPLHVIFK